MHSSFSSSSSSSFPLLALFLFSWSAVPAAAEAEWAWPAMDLPADSAEDGQISYWDVPSEQEAGPQGHRLVEVGRGFPERSQEQHKSITDVFVPAQVLAKRSVAKRSLKTVRLCGRQLVQSIRVACINKKSRGKRSAGDMRPFYTSVYQPDMEESSWNNEAHDLALTGNVNHNRPNGLASRFKTVSLMQNINKRGAFEECCARPCTRAHLQTYC